MVDIPIGAEIYYINDENIKARVTSLRGQKPLNLKVNRQAHLLQRKITGLSLSSTRNGVLDV